MKRTSIQTLFENAAPFSGDVCAQPGAHAFVVSVERPHAADPIGDDPAP